MVLDNKNIIPQEKNLSPNFSNNQESTGHNLTQEAQPDFVGFRPELVQPETVQSTPEQQQTTENSEKNNEQHLEIEKNLDTRIKTLKKKLKQSKKKNNQIPIIKDETTLRIEKVMEDGLEDTFKELTTIQKQEFKIKGEETAWKIRQVLKKTHIKIKEIFKLLLEWLRMLPGVNKFFLEQEAKIKADKIVSLKKVIDGE